MSNENELIMEEQEEESFDSGVVKRKLCDTGFDNPFGMLAVDPVAYNSWAPNVTMIPNVLNSLKKAEGLVQYHTMMAYLYLSHLLPKKPRLFKEVSVTLAGSQKPAIKPYAWCCCSGELAEGKPMTPEIFMKLKDNDAISNVMPNGKSAYRCPHHSLSFSHAFCQAIADPKLGKARNININIDIDYVDVEWLTKECKFSQANVDKLMKLKVDGSNMLSLPPAPRSKLTETSDFVNPMFIMFAHLNCKIKKGQGKFERVHQNGTLNFGSLTGSAAMKDKVSFRCEISGTNEKENPCFFAFAHPSLISPAGSGISYTQIMSAFVKFYFNESEQLYGKKEAINEQVQGKQLAPNF